MNKRKACIFVVLLFILTSCWEEVVETQQWLIEELEKKPPVTSVIPIIKEEQINSEKKDELWKTLQINSKCIGCGICPRIAPENFKMDFETRKAVVISQKDIYSDKIDQSIKICPTDAIEIL